MGENDIRVVMLVISKSEFKTFQPNLVFGAVKERPGKLIRPSTSKQ